MGICGGSQEEVQKKGSGPAPRGTKPYLASIRKKVLAKLRSGNHFETVVITVPKANFKEFMVSDQKALLNSMMQTSEKIFLPVALTPCPSDPENNVMVLMRASETINRKNGPFKLGKVQPSHGEVTKLVSRYQLKPLNLISKGTDMKRVNETVLEEARNQSKKNLRLLGGIQYEPNSVELLYFKEEGEPSPQGAQIGLIDLYQVQWGQGDFQTQQIEDPICAQQTEGEGILQCCISFKVQKLKGLRHIMIFQDDEIIDKCYSVHQFGEGITLQKEEQTKGSPIAQETISALERSEMEDGFVTTCMVNTNFADSYIIKSKNV